MLLLASCGNLVAEEPVRKLHEIPDDLELPKVTDEVPAAGRRVRHRLPQFADTGLYHVLYLPPEWQPDGQFPVMVEYPGNGGARDRLGDICTGKMEDCKLGYGLSGGQGWICICLPFVQPEKKQHALNWWGDAEATAAYCREAVQLLLRDLGGDPEKVVLTGFSRGAIAGNYIGLRDDETAKLWRAMILHSHYDGVRRWGFADDDAESARRRLARFGKRPQFIAHELSVEPTRKFLQGADVSATFLALPWPNHSDAWVMKDTPARAEARRWLSEVIR